MFSTTDPGIGLEGDRPGRPDLARRTRMLYALVLVLGLQAVVWLDRLTGPHQELGFFYLAILVLAGLELASPGWPQPPGPSWAARESTWAGAERTCGPAGFPENWLARAASAVVGGWR